VDPIRNQKTPRIYAPQVDLTRQPNWLRNNTTYGEDPFVNGQLAIQEVSGIQSQGLWRK